MHPQPVCKVSDVGTHLKDRVPSRGTRNTWAHKNLMKFNKSKCPVLPLGLDNPRHGKNWRTQTGKLTESSPPEKEVGFLMGEKLDTNQE